MPLTRFALAAALALVASLGTSAHPAGAAQLGEASLDYYLPAGGDYDPEIPTPASVLGYEVGTWHVRHDQLVRYMETLAESSDRVSLEVTGHTHEQRPLLVLTITSEENHSRLEDLRQRHLQLSDPGSSESLDPGSMPVVAYMGYGVHGNEPSGSNASLVVAYHLAAARNEATRALLDRTVILLDPSLNPDGHARFAHWANTHRGKVPVADPRSREHREPWPNGRTNHYWFDLNRDWLLAQHPESQARLEQFHSWRPNVHTDFHEMGTNSTYFFQPGVPSRKNPLTPDRNVELTAAIARYHADALDAIGSLYYSEETFDDFYYGKGSTYPDVHGAVGILFEQASSRGHVQESIHGTLGFPFTIRNQVRTSLSTLKAAFDLRVQLLEYQRDFHRRALDEGRSSTVEAYVFGDAADPRRTHHLVELLRRHRVEVHALARAVDGDGHTFEPGSSFAVPLAQPRHRLVRTLFERQLDFEDSTFYDVSTWTLPLAFGVPSTAVARGGSRTGVLGDAVDNPQAPVGRFEAAEGAYAYAFEWFGHYAPRALYRLQRSGVRTLVAKLPFEADVAGAGKASPRAFARGTVVIPATGQPLDRGDLETRLNAIAAADGVDIYPLESGLTPGGVDLGSPSLRPLETPRPAIVVGRGMSTYETGQAWHLLDARFGLETTLLPRRDLTRVDLSRYSHLIFMDVAGGGRRGAAQEPGPGKAARHALSRWVRDGGVLLAVNGSAQWATDLVKEWDGPEGAPEPMPTAIDGIPTDRRPYDSYEPDRAARLVGGSIFSTDLDLTHPLAFGFPRRDLAVFKNDADALAPQDDPYSAVAVFSGDPVMSGYVSAENADRLARTPALVADRMGDGLVVRMAFDPTFRAFWYGTEKLVLNALFFGDTVNRTGALEEPR
ncbi:MAG: M14 metallopeptidase family protein [Acidobacteriota bacterium]